MIDVYPQPEQLGNIRQQSQGTGGAPYNVLIDLARHYYGPEGLGANHATPLGPEQPREERAVEAFRQAAASSSSCTSCLNQSSQTW